MDEIKVSVLKKLLLYKVVDVMGDENVFEGKEEKTRRVIKAI